MQPRVALTWEVENESSRTSIDRTLLEPTVGFSWNKNAMVTMTVTMKLA